VHLAVEPGQEVCAQVAQSLVLEEALGVEDGEGVWLEAREELLGEGAADQVLVRVDDGALLVELALLHEFLREPAVRCARRPRAPAARGG
jgi:hypothetical protein